MVYTVGEMAKLLGVPSSTLRYYDKEELQHTMDVLDFKCWYYETARDAGTVQVPQSMSVEELPPQFRNLKRDLAKVPIVD